MLRRSTIAGVIAVSRWLAVLSAPTSMLPPRRPRPTTRAATARWHRRNVPVAGGAAQTFVSDRDIPADWYGLFQSEQLDDLVRRALHDSPTVEAAKAALRSAENTTSPSAERCFCPRLTDSSV